MSDQDPKSECYRLAQQLEQMASRLAGLTPDGRMHPRLRVYLRQALDSTEKALAVADQPRDGVGTIDKLVR